MPEFERFSEAAVLYARNVPVIERMADAMKESIAEFIAALTAQLRNDLQPHRLETDLDSAGCWQAFAIETWDRPYVGFDPRPYTIVHPGEIDLYVQGPFEKTTESDIARIHRLAESPELLPFAFVVAKSKHTVLRTTFAYGERNPVDAVAGAIGTILRSTDAAYSKKR